MIKKFLWLEDLKKQKNYNKMLKDFSNSNFNFDIVGSGSLRDEIFNLSIQNNTKVNLLGNLQNDVLLKKYSDYKFFYLHQCLKETQK